MLFSETVNAEERSQNGLGCYTNCVVLKKNAVYRRVDFFYGDTLFFDSDMDEDCYWNIYVTDKYGDTTDYSADHPAVMTFDKSSEILKAGNKIVIYFNNDDSRTCDIYVKYKKGDIDQNGYVDEADAALLIKTLFNETEDFPSDWDLNYNDEIDIRDAVSILESKNGNMIYDSGVGIENMYIAPAMQTEIYVVYRIIFDVVSYNDYPIACNWDFPYKFDIKDGKIAVESSYNCTPEIDSSSNNMFHFYSTIESSFFMANYRKACSVVISVSKPVE